MGALADRRYRDYTGSLSRRTGPIRFRAREGSTSGCAVRQRVAQARDRAALLSDAAAGFAGRDRSRRWAALAVAPLAAGGLVARRRRALSPGPARGRGPHVSVSSPQAAHLIPFSGSLFGFTP